MKIKIFFILIAALCVARASFALLLPSQGNFNGAGTGSVFRAGSNATPILGVRNDAASTLLAPLNGGYGPIAVDSNGRVYVNSIAAAEQATGADGSLATAASVYKLLGIRDSNSVIHAVMGNTDGSIWVDISHYPGALPVGAATAANQAIQNGSLVTIVANTSVIPISFNGSGSAASATVAGVTTLVAPLNAVGFILMNLDTSTANVRWAVGRVASATLGEQLQPGRDTGFVPVGANVSICAEAGTQNYDIQWVVR